MKPFARKLVNAAVTICKLGLELGEVATIASLRRESICESSSAICWLASPERKAISSSDASIVIETPTPSDSKAGDSHKYRCHQALLKQ